MVHILVLVLGLEKSTKQSHHFLKLNSNLNLEYPFILYIYINCFFSWITDFSFVYRI